MSKYSLFSIFFLSICISVSIRYFLIQSFQVESSSMSPTLQKGDQVLSLSLKYSPQLKIKDVIIFQLPNSKNKYIKRITKIYKSGDPLSKMGNDTYFLAGDNKNNSLNSLDFGLIENKYIHSKALLVFFPFSNFKIL